MTRPACARVQGSTSGGDALARRRRGFQIAVAVVSMLMSITRLAAADEPVPDTKDRDTAITLSAGGTVASIGLVLLGASSGNKAITGAGLLSSLITPAAGEIYAGKPFTAGTGIRLASAGLGVLGVVQLTTCTFASGSCDGGGGGLPILGGLGYATGIVWDIATAGRAVDDHNARLHVRVTPAVIPTTSSSHAIGVGVSGAF